MENRRMHISGQTAIVTGASSGLGAATARMLSKAGANVALFDRNKNAGETLAEELGGLFLEVDVTQASEVDHALNAVKNRYGLARILVNCAGIAPAIKTVSNEFVPHPLEDFRRVIEINLVGTFLVLSYFAARVAAAGPVGEEAGVIVNTASIAAYEGQVGHAAYSASKAGIVGLTLPIARELAASRIRVMTIAPGVFETPLLMGMSDRIRESIAKQIPHPNRFARPDEFAQLVEAIVTNPVLNGETIRIDGAARLPAR